MVDNLFFQNASAATFLSLISAFAISIAIFLFVFVKTKKNLHTEFMISILANALFISTMLYLIAYLLAYVYNSASNSHFNASSGILESNPSLFIFSLLYAILVIFSSLVRSIRRELTLSDVSEQKYEANHYNKEEIE